MKKLISLIMISLFLYSCGPKRIGCGPKGICIASEKQIFDPSKTDPNKQTAKICSRIK